MNIIKIEHVTGQFEMNDKKIYLLVLDCIFSNTLKDIGFFQKVKY